MMQPFIVEPSVPRITYRRGEVIENHPINLSFCRVIRKSRLHWYPDNVGVPNIVFEGVGTSWTYNTDDERDADYEHLLEITRKIARGESL